MKDLINERAFTAILKHYGADYQDGSLSPSVVAEMLDTHIERKAHIFKLFGGKLKIEKEIETTVDRNTAFDILHDLQNQIPKEKKLFFVRSFLSSISIEEFSTNVVAKDIKIFNTVIPKGMKVSKALTKLCLPEYAHDITTKHSMAVQQMTTKGKLVLSIDPCDYITMSSNNSGWRSCHRLNGGEYRTGPLAYLRDSSTIICYMESSKPCEITVAGKEYTHSNKTWRQIAMVSPNLDFSIQERQYPNENTINANEVAKAFKELFEQYHNEKFKIESHGTDTLNDLHIDYANEYDEHRYYYNDISNEMFSQGNVVLREGQNVSVLETLPLPVKGEAVFCLNCGESIYDSDSLYCEDCDCYDCDDEEDEW